MARTFVPWVRRTAEVLAADGAEVVAFVRDAPTEFWSERSVVPGWSNRDLLAHMGGGNDQMVQTVLRAVIEGQELAPEALEPDTDSENAARVALRRGWPFTDVVAEYERGVDELQELLSRLRTDHEDVMLAGTSLTPGRLLRIIGKERHDQMHLEQLRASRDVAR